MKQSIADRLVQSLRKAGQHNSEISVPPRVVLWPDPERQWEPIVPHLQERMPGLLSFGAFDPVRKTGPAIWLKCMVDRALPEADWPENGIPVIYLPGISRRDLKNVSTAGLQLQPLLEYQYTGSLWLHENGKEWTVAAFIQNQSGMGVSVASDARTRQVLLTSLADVFNDPEVFYSRTLIDAEYLLSRQYPNAPADILKWMDEGDAFLSRLSSGKKQTFLAICQTSFEFIPDIRNIKDIAYKLGGRNGVWAQVWEYFSHAPSRYPRVQEYLRMAKPDDLGVGMFALPRDSWPQENDSAEAELRAAIQAIEKTAPDQLGKKLEALARSHAWRSGSVWVELGQAPLLTALEALRRMHEVCARPYSSETLDSLVKYYTGEGYLADLHMRQALSAVQAVPDIEAVAKCIRYIYKPWLEGLTAKYQAKFNVEATHLAPPLDGEVVLFVDALRYDVARELSAELEKSGIEVKHNHHLSAVPTVTPTAKPFNSPIAGLVQKASEIREFRPSYNGKELTTEVFRDALKDVGFEFIRRPQEISPDKKYWLEIGTLDSQGHSEQAGMVRRIPDAIREIMDCIRAVREAGAERMTIVTDHGWLLLPGGLPKEKILKELTETRWGRCALIAEGARVDLPHYPWSWNPGIFIAYAPGISFFKANAEYAHGGISLQECVVPRMKLTFKAAKQLSGKITSVSWNHLICHIELSGAEDGFIVDLRRKKDDPATSIVLSKPEKRLVAGGKARLLADDSVQGTASHVVLTNQDGIVLDSHLTTVGS